MILHLFLFMFLTITSSPSTSAQTNCSHLCKGGGRSNLASYPFGFSKGCEILLNCSDNGQIQLGQYPVRKITSDRIVINFPANCNRQFNELDQLSNTNFALTSRNAMLLKDCNDNSTVNDCVISASRGENHFNIQHCDSGINSTFNCYSEDNPDREEFLNMKKLEATRCQILFTSVTADSQGNTVVSLEFQSMEFGWWVSGECNCDRNAVCRNVSRENQRLGYRCHCNEGYVGHGFVSGDGCRRAPRDHKEDNGADWGLIISIVLGFVLGLFIIMAPLKVNRSWKIAYFRLLSKVIKL